MHTSLHTHAIVPTVAELVSLRQTAKRLPYQAKARGAHSLSGVRLTPVLGSGLAFDHVRQYQPGDDVSTMDWKVTARTHKPHVKQYQQERERPVFIIIDQRASMFFGTRVMFKSTLAAQASALMAWLAVAHGERLGACLLTDNEVMRLPAKSGAHHVLRLFSMLSHVSMPTQTSSPLGLTEALAQVQPVLPPRALIVLLTDFAGIDAQTLNILGQLRARRTLVAGFLYDKAEKTAPPPSVYPITDGVAQTHIDLTKAKYVQQYQSIFTRHFQQVQTLCRNSHVPLYSLATHQPLTTSPIMHWLCQQS